MLDPRVQGYFQSGRQLFFYPFFFFFFNGYCFKVLAATLPETVKKKKAKENNPDNIQSTFISKAVIA